jgi:hypothetical protein
LEKRTARLLSGPRAAGSRKRAPRHDDASMRPPAPRPAPACAQLQRLFCEQALTTVDGANTALGLVYSSAASLHLALEHRRGVFFSRRRGMWWKGESSGAVQVLRQEGHRAAVRQGGAGGLGEPSKEGGRRRGGHARFRIGEYAGQTGGQGRDRADQ